VYAARLALASILTAAAAAAQGQGDLVKIASPNGQIEFRLMIAQPAETYALPRIAYQVYYRGKPLIDTSFLGYQIEDPVPLLGENVGLLDSKTASVDETYTVPAGKTNPIRNHYNSVLAEYLQNGSLGRRISIEARAYDDGAAFRYIVPNTTPLPEIRIDNEETEFNFAKDGESYPLILRNFQTNYGDEFSRLTISGIHPESLIGLPFLLEQPGVGWVAITEAQRENYAGLYLSHLDGGRFIATLAPRADQAQMAVYSKTPLVSSWRVLAIASDPGKLIESNLTMNLNPPSAIADPSWIKPGKALSTEASAPLSAASVKHLIDFASDAKLEYILIDPRWAATAEGLPPDVATPAPAFDLQGALAYAKSKRVGVWLAADWNSIDRQMDRAFPMFEKWGVSGVVVGGLSRTDQWMVDFCRRVAATAAAHRLMIDFHGAFLPDGIARTYPNVLTQEAVLGSEYLKSSARPNPLDDVTFVFTRMIAGPMDYGPGGFDNATAADFISRGERPMTLGTRAHQLALFVAFDSPLTIIPENPEAYRGQKEFEFIKEVPASWEETQFVAGKIGAYAVVARRSGKDWYLGAIASFTPREIEIPLAFLGKGGYAAEIYSDAGIDRKTLNSATMLKLNLASGGGAAIRFRPAS
jgi:alpha-glucosidase